MQLAIGYLRVSSDEQARSGLGIEAQRQAIEQYAAARGLVIVAWFSDEGLSGGKPIEARPGLAAAIEACQRGTVLLVAKRDRLARDTKIAYATQYMVERRGGRVVSVEDGESGDEFTNKIIEFTKDMVAMVERMNGQMRMKATWKAKRARGEHIGMAPPFGKKLADDGRTVIDDPEAQVIIREMVRRHLAGESLHAIARWLNDNEVKTPTMKMRESEAWRADRIKRKPHDRIPQRPTLWYGKTAWTVLEREGMKPRPRLEWLPAWEARHVHT